MTRSLDEVAGISVRYLWLVASTDGEVVSEVGHELNWHTVLGGHGLVIAPDLDLILVHRMDTTQTFTDAGEGLFTLLGMIKTAGSCPGRRWLAADSALRTSSEPDEQARSSPLRESGDEDARSQPPTKGPFGTARSSRMWSAMDTTGGEQ